MSGVYLEWYTVRPMTNLKDNEHFEVAKWTGDSMPQDTYDVYITKEGHQIKKVFCNCLGFRKRPGQEHKHVKLVLEWLSDGAPIGASYSLKNLDAKKPRGYNWEVRRMQ